MTPVVPGTQPDPARVLTQATLRAAEHLDFSDAELARIIGASPSSVSRMGAGIKMIDPQSKEGELALLLVRLYRSLDALVGYDSRRRAEWLGSYNHAFHAVPRQFVQSIQGLVTAVNYLDGLVATV